MTLMKIEDIPTRTLKDEKFFVDTNIWVLFFLANNGYNFDLNINAKEKTRVYSKFIEDILSNQGKIFTSPLSLSELGHVIEKKMYNTYTSNNKSSNFSLKGFRKIHQERSKVIQNITDMWDSIKAMNTIFLDFTISKDYADEIINTLKSFTLDSYDAIFIHTMQKHKIRNIITDDKDFEQLSGIKIDVYTM